jgi:hypothetical protein
MDETPKNDGDAHSDEDFANSNWNRLFLISPAPFFSSSDSQSGPTA